jgi:hypothetical protein
MSIVAEEESLVCLARLLEEDALLLPEGECLSFGVEVQAVVQSFHQ